MTLKLTLATATALGLLMGGAMAGDGNTAVIVQSTADNSGFIDQSSGDANTAKFVQEGTANSGSVMQDGDGNRAGAHVPGGYGTYNPGGTSGYNYMFQQGSNNTLTIKQTQKGNSVAIDGNLRQIGNFNSADITQHGRASSGNRVNSVTQTSSTSATQTTNELTVFQDGSDPIPGSDDNYTSTVVSSVNQNHTGGTKNSLALAQTGGIYQQGNLISSAVQDGSGNIGNVDQHGRSNRLALLSQAGDNNTADLDFVGNGNGTTGFAAGGRAAGVGGVTQANVLQTGSGNTLGYDVTGDNNSFGFNQDGSGNRINGVATGNDHQVAVNQVGDGNTTDVLQTGAGNDAGVSTVGNSNQLNIRQEQAGASGNLMTVSITGNNNNNVAVTGPLSGAADAARDLVPSSLSQGDLFQDGSNNQLTMTVLASNGNAFATFQDGDNNRIEHTISGGNGNQAVVAQNGNGNQSVTTQIGSGNNLGVSQ